MTRREAIDACRSLPDAYEDYPFDGNWAVMRHQTNRKMFAAVYDHDGRVWINVKAEPAYHMNKQHWISIILDGSMTGEEVFHLIDDSYRLTAPGTKRRQPRQA